MSKSGAAFDTTAIKDVASGFGSHTLEETMLAGAVSFLWLKSSFRHNLPYYTVLGGGSSNALFKMSQINNVTPLDLTKLST